MLVIHLAFPFPQSVTMRLNFMLSYLSVLGTISLKQIETKKITFLNVTTCQYHLEADFVLIHTGQVTALPLVEMGEGYFFESVWFRQI